MDRESIKRLGVNPDLFDLEKSNERFNQDCIYHTIELHMVKENRVVCRECHSTSVKSRGTKLNTFNHSTVYEKNINISIYRHVYKCTKCNAYTIQENPFLLQGTKCTHSSDMEILNELKSLSATYTNVAKRFNVSITYVQNLFDRKVDIKRQHLPMVLAIDEVFIRKLTKSSFCCVLYDPIGKKIIDVLDSRHKDFLINYFSRIPQEEKDEVIFVSMDLYKNYRDVLQKCLPKAIICADSFHVIKNLNKYFNKIRIRIMHKYEKLKNENSYYYWFFKKFWKFLLMNIKDASEMITIRKTGMTMSITAIIETMLKIDDELKDAYYLKETYREFNLTATKDNCTESFEILCEAFKNSKSKEFHAFYNLLLNWRQEILNSFNRIGNYRISNGNLERKNSDIKTIIKNACGMTNFTRTRNRIMYCLNWNTPIKPERKKKTNKYVGKKRKPYKKKEH